MKIAHLITAVGLAAAAASPAMADLAFSFADPSPGRQLRHNAGAITYDTGTLISFIVDGSSEPNAFTTVFSVASLELNLTMGSSTTFAGITTAPVSGNFIIRDTSDANPLTNIILTGAADSGAFVRISGTNSILFSDETGFAYLPGPALLALLVPGRTIVNPQEAVFTVTGIQTPANAILVGQGGTISNFDANASFSGNATVIPTPGSMALVGLGGLAMIRRRRA